MVLQGSFAALGAEVVLALLITQILVLHGSFAVLGTEGLLAPLLSTLRMLPRYR